MSKVIVDLACDLIEIPSVSGNTGEAEKCFRAVRDFLGEGFASKTFTKNGIVSVLWGNEKTLLIPKLLFCGHIDVVNAPESLFTPKIENGKIFGRGAGDMKGFVAAMAASYKRLVNDGFGEGLGLLLTADEEIGGFNGALFVVEEGLRPEYVFIPDGEHDFSVVGSQKAPHHFHVLAKGPGGHASRAFEIDNPVNRLLSLYNEMRQKYSLATPKNDWHSTFEMTAISTQDNAANKIPSSVEAWFSWRWPLEEFSFAEGVADMERLVKKYDCQILSDGHGLGEGCLTDMNSKIVKRWKKAIEPLIGKKVGAVNMHASTDGRHFYKYGSQVLVTSGITGGHHSNNEWVDIESLEKLEEGVYRLGKKQGSVKRAK